MAGFFCVSFFLLIISWASRGGIGGGDVKLMAAAGFLCGVKAILQAAMIGFFLAGLYGAFFWSCDCVVGDSLVFNQANRGSLRV